MKWRVFHLGMEEDKVNQGMGMRFMMSKFVATKRAGMPIAVPLPFETDHMQAVFIVLLTFIVADICG